MIKAQSDTNPHKISTVLIIFFIALFVRLLIFFIYRDIPLADDTVYEYMPIANNLLLDKTYSIRGMVTAARMPLYPLFLAAIKFGFGAAFITVSQLIMILLECFTCVFVFYIAKEIVGRQSALLAAIFCTLYVFSTYLSLKLATETIFSFFIAASLLCLINALKYNKAFLYALSAILSGFSVLTRSSTLILSLIVFFYLLVGRNNKTRLYGAFIYIFIYLAVLSPWVIRNYIVFHRFLPCESLTGIVINDESKLLFQAVYKKEHKGFLEHANIPKPPPAKETEPITDKAVLDTQQAFKKPKLNRSRDKIDRLLATKYLKGGEWVSGNEADAMYAYFKRTIERQKAVIKEHPFKGLRWFIEKLYTLWYTTESGRWNKIFILLHGLGIPLSIAGFFIRKNRFEIKGRSVLLVAIFYFYFIHIPTSITVRYLIPIMPFTFIGAAVILVDVVKFFRNEKKVYSL